MAKTVYNGKYATGSSQVVTGAGALLGLLVSHNQATVQPLTLYDNTAGSGTVLLGLQIDPSQNPTYLMFPRDLVIRFSVGLYAVCGNCQVHLWIVTY